MSRRTVVALLVIGVSLVLLFQPGLLGFPQTDGTFALAILGIVGGVGALVWGMNDGPRVDDGPDDGSAEAARSVGGTDPLLSAGAADGVQVKVAEPLPGATVNTALLPAGSPVRLAPSV